MSPRAAWRLEGLGFTEVYDYAAGKNDWVAAGLPTEGDMANLPRPGRLAVRDIPTCGIEDDVSEVGERPEVREAKVCIVVNEAGVVMGRLRERQLRDGGKVGDVMEAGPTTVRFDEHLPSLVERMTARKVGSIIITDPDGVFMGIMYRRDAQDLLARLHAEHEHHHHHHD
ncbi:MAG: CBS domain-containing protein [Actinomycetota bacterium]